MSSRVAKRYAKPLLELADQQGKLETVKEDMEMFVNLGEESRELTNMLKSPIIPHLKKLSILEALFKGKVDDLTFSIFDIMVRKNREAVLLDVGSSFLDQYNKLKGIIKATVTTAAALTEQQVAEFEQLVNRISGKKTLLEQEIDPEVIGGFKLLIEDRQIDETIESKLNDLKLKFTNA